MNTSDAFPVRTLAADLSAGFPLRWFGGDAFRSHFFNALSMSFPVGEQSFIDSVQGAAKLLPAEPEHASLRRTIRDFIAQESSHSAVHRIYNAQLEQHGLVNRWQHWSTALIALADRRNVGPMDRLAVTAAFEHYTAVLADLVLAHGALLDDALPVMQALWCWHSVEETEHKAVAFDLYATLGGGYAKRVRWFLYATMNFIGMAAGQTVINLWRDRSLMRPSTWLSAARFLFGRHGIVWLATRPLMAYLRPGFHPWQQDNRALAAQWLETHGTQYRVLRHSNR